MTVWEKSNLDSSWYERAQEASIDAELEQLVMAHPELLQTDGSGYFSFDPTFAAAIQAADGNIQKGFDQWNEARQTPLERAADNVTTHLRDKAARSRS